MFPLYDLLSTQAANSQDVKIEDSAVCEFINSQHIMNMSNHQELIFALIRRHFLTICKVDQRFDVPFNAIVLNHSETNSQKIASYRFKFNKLPVHLQDIIKHYVMGCKNDLQLGRTREIQNEIAHQVVSSHI